MPYSTRIGLRYINVLTSSNTHKEAFAPEVIDLLRPELTAILKRDEIQDPQFAITQIRAEQNEGGITFQSGIVRDNDQFKERSFVLDIDRAIVEEITFDVDGLMERLDRFHAEIYNAFRWSIPDIEVFGPSISS